MRESLSAPLLGRIPRPPVRADVRKAREATRAQVVNKSAETFPKPKRSLADLFSSEHGLGLVHIEHTGTLKTPEQSLLLSRAVFSVVASSIGVVCAWLLHLAYREAARRSKELSPNRSA